MMIQRGFFATLSSFLFLSIALGALPHNRVDVRDPLCSRVFRETIREGEQIIVPSGRDADVLPAYREAVRVLFEKGGICDKLGIPVPPQILTFASSGEISLLASLGRHAVPHETEGDTLFNHGAAMGGVLEFVTPGKTSAIGCTACRSFYSDTTPIHEQISILFHVIGHNHFSLASGRARERNTDVIDESLHLYSKMVKYAQTYGEEEVRSWYYQIQSLQRMQDLVGGGFKVPEVFDPRKVSGKEMTGSPDPVKHPQRPEPHILQFMTTNLPADFPDWKRDMLATYERMNRILGFYVGNKIMNEGWATLMMEIIMGHSPYATDDFNFNQASLLAGVAYPSLNNPYYLGREAWRRIRARFNESFYQQEARKGNHPTPLERDRAFIAYAEPLIAQMDDYDFLRFALDAQWVHHHKLHLRRPATWDEWDHNLPPSKDIKNDTQWLVTSKDPRHVVDWLAKKVADKSYIFPAIDLVDSNANGKSIFWLNHNTKVNHNIPLHQGNMIQAMYVLGQIRRQPVALRTSLLIDAHKHRKPDPLSGFRLFPWWNDWFAPAEPRFHYVDVVVHVSADGHVSMRSAESKPNAETLRLVGQVTGSLQKSLNVYRAEVKGGFSEFITDREEKRFQALAVRTLNEHTRDHMQIMSQSPTAADAILKYMRAIQRALPRKLRLLAEGKLPFDLTAQGGARIRVLPRIPQFTLDVGLFDKYQEYERSMGHLSARAERFIQRVMNGSTPRSTDDFPTRLSGQSVAFDAHLNVIPVGRSALSKMKGENPPTAVKGLSMSSVIGSFDDVLDSGDFSPGDRDWGPRPQKSDDGSQDQDDDDESPGEDPGRQPGDGLDPGDGDSGVIDIPPEVYAEVMSEQYEIPNLRPKPGRDPKTRRIVEGARSGVDGEVLYSRMMKDILSRGKLALQHEGATKPSWIEVLKKGFALVTEDIHRVPDHAVVKDPDTNVVVIIVIDMSGSMSGLPYKIVRRVVQNMRLLLSKRYKSVTFRFVGFSGEAHEFGADEWYGKFIGGGTEYSKGIRLAAEIRSQYKDSQTDAIMLVAGDAQDVDGAGAVAELKKIHPTLQYNAFLHTDVFMGGDPVLLQFYMNNPDSDESRYLGYAHTNGTESNPTRHAMDQLFGKKRK